MPLRFALCQNAVMKLVAVILLGISLAFASPLPLKAVFGPDDRVAMEDHTYPYSAIVRLENKQGGHCTGSLIARDIVLTNSHCLQDESGTRLHGIKVIAHGLPGFAPTTSVTEMVLGTTKYDDEPGQDWALVQLNKPIGDVFGSFKLASNSIIAGGYTLAGYSGDFRNGRTAGVHTGCNILGELARHGVVLHDCDMTKGASGSAIWQLSDTSAVIYALNSAQNGRRDERDTWTSQTSNLAIPVQTFSAHVRTFIEQSIKQYETGLVVCNTTARKHKFAFGYWNNSHSLSKGWSSIAPGRCEEIKLPAEIREAKELTKLYVFSEDLETNATYFRDFCVGGFFSFEKDEGHCIGTREKVFSQVGEIKPGKINRIDIR